MNRLMELVKDLRELQVSRNDAWRILAAKYAGQPVPSPAFDPGQPRMAHEDRILSLTSDGGIERQNLANQGIGDSRVLV